MITIYFDKDRINKQVIKPGEAFFIEKGKNKSVRVRTHDELMIDARAMAHDISGGVYESVTVELN